MKKILSVILILALITVIYVCSGFYHIEHIKNEDGRFLITQKDKLKNLLDDYSNAFNRVTDIIINDDASDTHDYYFDDDILKDNNDFTILRNQCNVLWVRTNVHRNRITFYQTMDTQYNNTILLSYECEIDESGGRTWDYTNEFPTANKKETMIMKLYEMLY